MIMIMIMIIIIESYSYKQTIIIYYVIDVGERVTVHGRVQEAVLWIILEAVFTNTSTLSPLPSMF